MKHAPVPSALLLLTLGLCLQGAHAAQTIYKCGSSYSQTPCPDGSALSLDDRRDPAQKRQTDEAVKRDAQLAREMEQQRLSQEKANQRRPGNQARSEAAATSQPAPKSELVLTPKKMKVKHQKPDQFVAEIPGSKPEVTRKPAPKK